MTAFLRRSISVGPVGGLTGRTLAALAGVGGVVCCLALWLDRQGVVAAAPAIMLYLVVATCVATRIGGSHPHSRFGPANLVTLIRAALASLIAGTAFVWPLDWNEALVIAALAAAGLLLDGVDGWLARRSGLVSSFGARFDMEIDALFVMILSVLAFTFEKAGGWVMLIGAMRYLFFFAGFLLPQLKRELAPSMRRKCICVVEVVALVLLLVPGILPPVSEWIAGTALALLAMSFAIDVARLMRAGA